MSRVNPRWIGVAIALLGVGMILSLALSWIAVSTRVDVADDRAGRAVAGVAQTQRLLAEQQRAAEESTCRILALGLPKPGEPLPSTDLGRARAQQYADEYRRRGCPT